MQVLNIHQRTFDMDPAVVGALLDTLASKDDRLWPGQAWPRMRLDRPLGEGAAGGHGPIRYMVEHYVPGRAIRFRFGGPPGFDGLHAFEILTGPQQAVILRHTLQMKARGWAMLSWPLVYRPLHDALLEDALATAQASLGLAPQLPAWSRWVRVLRWIASGGKAPAQAIPQRALPRATAPTLPHP
ncbi:hypothetical protein N8I74_04360 [Chitiniphilus purpureus]|uniref:SRPBCC family protein n=1 Tax=Chitiniphilus purpureus TaxID=2981137 RepID=A0ABY6DPG4_9NEIS|nr:hypothetical protein [Chitiniphilus sp. CD1]UXY16259.1 hypothetical protein N8I74_04360 [Chitiniphilus sp. CD1]